MKLSSSIQVNQSQEKVWEFMNDSTSFSLWQEGYESTVQISGKPGEKGSEANHVFSQKGRKFVFREEVLESDPCNFIHVILRNPVMDYDVKTKIEDVNGSTIVKMNSVVKLHAFSLKVLAPFLKRSFQRRQDSDLGRLKAVLESEWRDFNDAS